MAGSGEAEAVRSGEKQIFQHDSVVMFVVMRGVDECDGSILRELTQSLEFDWMLADFRAVAPSEFRPPLDSMSEPLAQLSAGRDLFDPLIDRRIRLLQSARPQSVDKDAPAILGGGWFVGSLYPDVIRCDLLAHRGFPWRLLGPLQLAPLQIARTRVRLPYWEPNLPDKKAVDQFTKMPKAAIQSD